MFEFFASIFGYLLEFLYNLVNNYGLAIILFTVIIKVLLLPLSIKQQKTMKKSAKLQEKIQVLQFKYKNNPEKLNQEMMDLYKNENMSPFSGCLTTIIQFILLLSIFYLVRSPLTYMEKLPSEDVNKYITQLQEAGKISSNAYPEIEPNPMFMYGICSICGFKQSISDKLKFCPECGSMMDELIASMK